MIGMAGVWPSANPFTLARNQVARMDNMFTFNGALQTWPGDFQKGTTQSADPVVGGFTIIQSGSVADTVYFTIADAYRWNSTDWAVEYEEITEFDDATYGPAGTGASVTNGSATVVGIGGTTWQSKEYWGDGGGNAINATQARANATAGLGDEFYIVSGAVPPNDGPTYRQRIKAIPTPGTFTLENNYGGTSGVGNYTIRKHFRGTANDFFSAIEFQGKAYFCQGVDELKEWDATRGNNLRIRSVVDTSNINAPPSGACLEAYANRIFVGRLTSYSVAPSFLSKRIAWCAEGNQYGWDPVSAVGAGNRAFIETAGDVQWLKRMDQSLVIYKEFDIWFAGETGRSTPAIFAEPKITAPRFGLLAPRSVMQIDASRHIYIGQEDFCMLVPFSARPLGRSAMRDWIYGQIDRENIVRAQAFYDDTVGKGLWLIPLGNDQNAIVIYDARKDVFEGPIYPGTTRKVSFIGNFISPPGTTTDIDSLNGTIDQQTWKLGSAALGAAVRTTILGSSAGRIDEVDFGSTEFAEEARTAVLDTPAVSTHAPLTESVAIRLTITYRHPTSLVESTVNIELSEDGFKTILGAAERTFNAVSTGKVEKAYFDFVVAAERIQARIRSSPGAIEILEVGIEATRVGVQADIS
jgi:hypothetical protein